MSSIYRFSIRSLRHLGVSRVVELAGQATLGDLQAVIVREFRLDWDHAWAFWLGGEWYERELEYGGHPGDGGNGEGARIEPLGLEPGDLLAHAHDFGEQRRHVLTLLAVNPPEPGVAYPRVVEQVGEAPSYYGDEEDTEEEFEDEPQPTGLDPPPSLVDRVNAAIEAFYDDAHQPPPAATLRASAELAQEALAACSTPGQVGRLDAALDSSLEEWLAALATRIEESDLIPVATALRARLQVLQGTAPFPAPLLEALACSLRRWEPGEPFRMLDDEPPELAWVVREVLEACTSIGRLAALTRLFSASVGAWLEDASLTLGLRGEPDAAVAIAARLASWRQSPDLLVELAGNLVEADPSQYPSARAAFRALLDVATSVPEWRYGTVERTWARHQAASGDPPGAESRLRALVGRRHLGTEERASAIEALAELLVVRGASDEAALLRGQAAELERRRAELTGGTVRNVGPKVGRNDPCPCGSGKKLKKCCGG